MLAMRTRNEGGTVSPENQQAIALDGTLADLLDLSLLAKQAHWNIVGPRFRALHLLLDDLAEMAREGADTIAERSATLGHSPDGRVATIFQLSSLPTIDPGMLHDAEAITAFLGILDAVADRIHSALEAFEKDVVTVDLFTGVLAAVEKNAWMLRAQGAP
jgi:starvation-inducible DNA-binding protein